MRRLVLALAALHVLGKAVCWPSMRRAPLSGDEIAYRDGGLALANAFVDLASLRAPDAAELQANVIGNGWFMPGPSALLAPLYVAVPDAGLTAMRTYLGVVSTLLLLLLAAVLYRSLGPRYAAAVLVLPGLIPMWLLFSYTAWGDVTGGLLIGFVLASLARLAQRLTWGEGWSLPSALGFGALLACSLYVRSTALAAVVGSLVLALLGVAVFTQGRTRSRSLAAGLLAIATFVVLLAPWSVAASDALDSRVTTTTSLPLSLAVTFGDPERLCFGPCPDDSGNVFFAAVRYSRAVAEVTGRSEVDVQGEMADYALQGLSTSEYARAVGSNADRFALHPNDFLTRLWPDAAEDTPARRIVQWLTWATYGVGLLALLLGALAVLRYPFEAQVVSLLVTLLVLACFLQPLVHLSSGRYWPTFAPLMGVALALVVGRHRNEAGRTSLVVAQAIAVITLLTGVLTLALLTI